LLNAAYPLCNGSLCKKLYQSGVHFIGEIWIITEPLVATTIQPRQTAAPFAATKSGTPMRNACKCSILAGSLRRSISP
jgi:hypothetical protein